MKLRVNIAANYASQAYAAIAGFAIVPFYLQALGHAAYGLVGFAVLLNGWMQLLDAGLSAAIMQEAARARAGVYPRRELRRLFRLVNAGFLATGALLASVAVWQAPTVAAHWLHGAAIDPSVLHKGLMLLFATMIVNWIGNPARSLLQGLEQQLSLSLSLVVTVSLRYGGGLVALYCLHGNVLDVLLSQLLAEVVQTVLLGLLAAFSLSRLPSHDHASGRLMLRPVLRMAATIAFTSTVWIVSTQSDRLLLSHWLTLTDYAAFVVAASAAGGVLLLNAPIGQIVMPRLTALQAVNDDLGLHTLYRRMTRFTAAVTGSATLVLGTFAEPLLYAWTGDAALARSGAPLLRCYAVGNGLLSLAAFAYYLQYAQRRLRLHVVGNLGVLLVGLPLLCYAAKRYGALGAAYVWLAENVVHCFVWTALIHARLAPGLHLRWMSRDILGVLAAPAALIAAVYWLVPIVDYGRDGTLVALSLSGLACLVLGLWGANTRLPGPARFDKRLLRR